MPTKQLGAVASSCSSAIAIQSATTSPTNTMVMGSPTLTSNNNAAAAANPAGNGSSGGSGSVMSAVEELVYEIKENLRLKARPTPSVLHHSSRSARPSPYHIPCRSWIDAPSASSTTTCGDTHQHQRHPHHPHQQLHHYQQHSRHPHRLATHARSKAGAPTSTASLTGEDDDDDRSAMDDPYEMLQTLLKSNNLVKEAVRRLQLNYDAIGGGDSDHDDTISPAKHDRSYFYDSDDETGGVRSPTLIRMCELEL